MAASPAASPRGLRTLWIPLAALAVGFGIALGIGPGERAPTPDADREAAPAALLEDSVIEQYRSAGAPHSGALHYRLRARRIRYFDDAGSSARLDAPALELHVPDAPPWRVEAQSGEIFAAGAAEAGGGMEGRAEGEERAVLRGSVHLSRGEGAPGRDAMELRTPALTLYPARDLAAGDQGVAIKRRSGGRAEASGFEIDLASGRIKLFSSPARRVAILAPAAPYVPAPHAAANSHVSNQ